MLAELTHRCPLQCAYCSNPVALDEPGRELELSDWTRVFAEAAALGVLQVHLSGGEPAARRDLVALTAAAARAGLYTNLITSGIALDRHRLRALRDAGLDHLQLSIQDAAAPAADRIAGYSNAHARKLLLAADVVALGLPLTINVVLHRANIDRAEELVALAVALKASRIELAHAQYHGWALQNRAMLMPTATQIAEWPRTVGHINARYAGEIEINTVTPDYFARRPKPCMGGWGRRLLNISPAGKALPCHAAETIPGLTFWSVREHSLSEIWSASPAFQAFRGTDWMREPCRSCSFRQLDFGGCRCQAFAIAGDAAEADPVCEKSPFHHRIELARDHAPDVSDQGMLSRRYRATVKVECP
jgi:PqqA peptide cyclase